MKNETTFRSYFYLSLVVALASLAYGQVPVAIAPSPHPQFLTSSGLPLSGGFIYTYIAGTTTLSNTYADSTGTVQNPDPIPLDVSGAPSNGTAQTGIWLSNQSYKFCAFNSSMVQQWCTDNVTSYFQLLNFANTWTFPQTFTSTITDTLADNQFILGVLGVQTTLDFPPPAGPVTLHFPNTADTIVGRATTDVLSKKSFTDYPTVGGSFNVVTTLCMNSTQTTQTGDVALHTIYTCSIPGNVLGATRALRITLTLRANVTGGSPVIFLKYGGTAISSSQVVSAAAGNSDGVSIQTIGSNIGGLTNSQSWDTLIESVFLAGVTTSGNVNHQLSAIDSTASQNLTVTFQGGANADSVTFYRLIVELL